MVCRPGFVALVFFITATLICADNQKGDILISDANVLLPFGSSKAKVKYLLKSSHGCFQWISQNPQVVEVEPVFQTVEVEPWKRLLEPASEKGCSTSAWISSPLSLPTTVNRTSTWVLAEETASGRLLRCEVFVDKIARIQIATKTRSLYKDDIELLQVHAHDAEGNSFSTLEGLSFQWSILPDEGNVNVDVMKTVLKFSSFKESSIEASPIVMAMEAKGAGTSAALIQGVDTGKAKVSARLIEAGYEEVSSSIVPISVLEPLQLEPSQSVYIVKGSELQFKLKTLKNKKEGFSVIDMPNRQYLWSSSNQTVASVDNRGWTFGSALGATTITAHYISMADNEASGMLHVTLPAYLTLKIFPIIHDNLQSSPLNNWYLIEGQKYLLEIEVYDAESHKIYTTSNLKFNVVLSSSYFQRVSNDEKLSKITLLALTNGVTSITASLEEVEVKGRNALERPISVQQDMVVITEGVKIIPSSVLLPYHPKIKHQFGLKATGGSGEYNWYSQNESIATVSASGVVTAKGEGSTSIMVVDKKNVYNHDKIIVTSVSPSSLSFLPTQVEVQINYPLHLPVALYDQHGRPFENCSALPLQWAMTDQTVFEIDETESNQRLTPPHGACSVKTLRAVKEGFTTVIVRYGDITAEVTVFAFPALRVITPVEYALVTLGSSAIVSFDGGPNPWVYDPTTFYEELVAEYPNKVRVERIQQPNIHRSYSVTCLAHFDQNISISVGNRECSSNPHPTRQQIDIRFSCQPPADILFYPQITQDSNIEYHSFKCPETVIPSISSFIERGNLPPTKYQIRNNQTVRFSISLFDKHSRLFHNFSSVEISISSSNKTLADFREKEFSANALSSNLKIFTSEGTAVLQAQVKGFNTDILHRAHISSESSVPPVDMLRIKKELDIRISSNVQLTPSEAVLYNHPNNSLRIEAIGGSGYYRFNFASNTSAADISHEPGSNIVDLIPRFPGHIIVSVVDLCLAGSQISRAVIKISDISSLEVVGRELMMVGVTTPLEVVAHDDEGTPFATSQYRYMNISYQFDHKILSLWSDDRREPLGHLVRGVVAGSSRVTFLSHLRNGGLVTKTKLMQVYPPFQLRSHQFALLPAARLQLSWIGGPPSVAVEVVFRLDDTSIAEVDSSSGVLSAKKKGSTRVIAVMEGIDPYTKSRVRFGEDVAEVIVSELAGIQIHSGTNKLVIGNELSLWLLLENGENPFAYGSLGFDVKWTVQNVDVIGLVLPDCGNCRNGTKREEKGFSVRAIAKAPGQTRLTATLSSPSSLVFLFSTSIQLSVLEPLKLVSPSPSANPSLLLLPQSSYLVATNQEPSQLSFQIVRDDIGTESLISIDERGLISTRSTPGSVFVIITQKGTRPTQSIMLKVAVRTPQYLQVLPACKSNQIVAGEKAEYFLYLKDEFGHPFDSYEGLSFDYQTDNSDTISVLPFTKTHGIPTFNLKSLKPGSVITHIYETSRPDIQDYLKITVQEFTPQITTFVFQGGVISVPSEGNRRWQSDNTQVLLPISAEQNGDHHISHFRANGLGNVNIISSSARFGPLPVTVVRLDGVKLDKQFQDVHISNTPEASGWPKEYKYLLSFWAGNQKLKSTAYQPLSSTISHSSSVVVSHQLTVRCEVSDPFYLRVENRTDESGEVYCVVIPLPPSSQSAEYPSSVSLIVTVYDQHNNVPVHHKETIPFHHSYTSQLSSHRKVTISSHHPAATFEVTGSDLHLLQYVSSHSSDITVKRMNLQSNSVASGQQTMTLEVNLLRPETRIKEARICLIHPHRISEQEEVIVVVDHDQAPSNPTGSQSASLWLVSDGLALIIILTCISLFLFFLWFSPPLPPSSFPPSATPISTPTTSNALVVASPLYSPPSPGSPMSATQWSSPLPSSPSASFQTTPLKSAYSNRPLSSRSSSLYVDESPLAPASRDPFTPYGRQTNYYPN